MADNQNRWLALASGEGEDEEIIFVRVPSECELTGLSVGQTINDESPILRDNGIDGSAVVERICDTEESALLAVLESIDFLVPSGNAIGACENLATNLVQHQRFKDAKKRENEGRP